MSLTGKVCGFAALVLAIVAIFIPITGILVSLAAAALAVVAGLCGQHEFAFGTSTIVRINSFILSPLIWISVMWPGQLWIAFYVLCMVGAPLAAVAVYGRFIAR